MSVDSRVEPFLDNLLAAAQKAKIDLRVASAYRSFGEQSTLKSTYSVTYGAGSANAFSADQGYSEHQLGTTVDFTTVATNGALDGFNATPAYTWLLANAYKYGFVLSYPEDNALRIRTMALAFCRQRSRGIAPQKKRRLLRYGPARYRQISDQILRQVRLILIHI